MAAKTNDKGKIGSGGDAKSADKSRTTSSDKKTTEQALIQQGIEKRNEDRKTRNLMQEGVEARKQTLSDRKLDKTQMALENQAQGDKAERKAKKVLRDLGFDRSGLGLHYGRRKAEGIDAYGIRNTPKGKTVGMMEAKSTRNPDSKGTKKEIMRSLRVDSKGLQQGSHLWNEDRLKQAASRGNRVARNIRSGQAQAGEGRIWQSRDYVYWENTSTGDKKAFRVISSSDGKKVKDLQEITSSSSKK